MKIEAYINDEAEEYIMNLSAQKYYGELWEFITRLTDDFNKGLYVIAGRSLNWGKL
jgi:hypothetical protein